MSAFDPKRTFNLDSRYWMLRVTLLLIGQTLASVSVGQTGAPTPLADPVPISRGPALKGAAVSSQEIQEARRTVTAFLRGIERQDAAVFQLIVSPMRDRVGKDLAKLRFETVRDAESILSYAITDISRAESKRLSLDIYVVTKTEGSVFVSEAIVDLRRLNSGWKLESFRRIER